MQLANIVPPFWTGMFPKGGYRMALAHWVPQNPGYAKEIRSEDAYVLLDNGIFEGAQATMGQINEAITAVGADEVVLPDSMGDPKQTLRLSWAALSHLDIRRVMFVPQGCTYEEWKGCLDAWLEKWRHSSGGEKYSLSLGVSSLRQAAGTKAQIGTRVGLLADAVGTGLPVHLLGVSNMSEFTHNELPLARKLGVRGVDTSSAFALAAKHQLLTPTSPKVFLGAPDEYETLPTWARRLALLNMKILSSWVEEGTTPQGVPTDLIRNVASRWLKYWQVGFATLEEVMLACGIPSGKYALLKEDNREVCVRPLERTDRLVEGEVDVRI